jgi:hypothetical protein
LVLEGLKKYGRERDIFKGKVFKEFGYGSAF